MIKAYKICFEGSWVMTDLPQNVYYECIDFDTGKHYFTLDEIRALNSGDKIERNPWIVECVLVKEGYIESLPEHDGR